VSVRIPKLILIVAALVLASVQSSRGDDASFAAGIEALKSSNFTVKQQGLAEIVDSGAERARTVLQALLDGRIYVRRSTEQVVLIAEEPPGVFEAASGAAIADADRADLKKVIINNQMRGALGTALARLSLRSPDPETRRSAVASLLGSLDESTVAMLRDALSTETDSSVQEQLRLGVALADLGSTEPARRLSAIALLRPSLHPEARNSLSQILGENPDGSPREPDEGVRAAAREAATHIDTIRALYGIAETALFGLSLGSVLVLAAIGLAITFGVMGVINMAHGELMMLGAYATWGVQQLMPNHIEASLFVAIPAAFLVSAVVGIAIERGVVRFLYGRPLETLLATFGVSLVLQQSVRSIFSPLNRAVSTPEWMSGQFVINEALALTYNRLYIIVFSIIVFLALVAILRFTTFGLQLRAVAQNRNMARAMGVRGGWIDAMTFGLGSGVAGLAGVALSQLTNVGPNLGQSHIVDSFMVVVFGGVGNLWGTLVAGLSLGIANKLLEPFAGAVLAKVLVLIFIILFIQRWPRGLFPQRGRAAEG